MTRTPVKSSQIHSLAYDPSTKTLEIEFPGRNGEPNTVYQYSGFEPEHYSAFIHAKSIGSHFHKNIRGKFEYKKIA